MVTYLPRTVPLKNSTASNYVTKKVTFDASKFVVFNEVKTEFESSAAVLHNSPSRFKFSFFDLLEIPPYSYISVRTGGEKPINADLNETLLANYVLTFDIFKHPEFRCMTMEDNIQVYCDYRSEKKGNKPDFVGSDSNKIHLFVKHEYILYTVLKIASLHTHFMKNRFVFKFSLFNATSNLRPEDKDMYNLALSGGISATIVIYGSSDSVIMSTLLRLVLGLFPDHEELGLMDTAGTLKLSPFNIRLNTLVSYAAGDRNTSCDLMLDNIGKIGSTPPYTIPKWFDDMRSKCTPATKDELNRQSQLFLGIDACNSDGSIIDYKKKCKEETITEDKKYCYITTTGDTLDPRTFIKARKMGGRRRSRKYPKKVRSNRRKKSHKKLVTN